MCSYISAACDPVAKNNYSKHAMVKKKKKRKFNPRTDERHVYTLAPTCKHDTLKKTRWRKKKKTMSQHTTTKNVHLERHRQPGHLRISPGSMKSSRKQSINLVTIIQ